MSDLTYQQRTAFDRLQSGNDKILAMNEAIRGRASFVTGASTAIVGLITAAKFLPENNHGYGVEFILLALVCVCSVAIYWLAALIWEGGETSISGTTDVNFLYDSYISKDIDVAYCNFATDLCQAMEHNKSENTLQAKRLSRMIFAFIVQLMFLALSIAWSSIIAYL